MSDIKIWRVYNNGEVKNESRVLWPHFAEGRKCLGYDGDVEAWSERNQKDRFGCAQIKQVGDAKPVILFNGYLSTERLLEIIENDLT